MRFLEKILHLISAHVLPSACIVCERHQEATLCTICLQSLRVESLINFECCYQCGTTLAALEVNEQHCLQCKNNPPYFDETYCLDRYDGALQNAVHQLKYQKRLAYAHGLASAWNCILSKQLRAHGADYLLPVPLSTQKLSARGFNQSWEIARRLDYSSNIRQIPYALKRHHHALPQAGGKLSTRRLAIQEMFYIDHSYIEPLQNKRVIIFDDVMTTGATLNEIARVLKDNGVSHVTNWVLLRTTKAPHV
jgi:ComF family protein